MDTLHSRRRFLTLLPGLALALALPTRRAWAGTAGPGHPKPRPGIDASHILPAERLEAEEADVREAFEQARTIPEILDGIRCHCGCAELPDRYSLLSCYEGEEPMARACHICQGQARLAFRLHRKGASLDEIRAAIDKEFG